MKKILGLDLGTNSIGWAVVDADEATRENETTYLKPTGISKSGSRIIPMSADILGEFDKGNSVSQTADRTSFRGVRRLHERNLLRRERLLRVLKLMNFLPEHFANQIDRFGKFINHAEPKLAWEKDETGMPKFLFIDSFNEMLADFAKKQPQLVADGKKEMTERLNCYAAGLCPDMILAANDNLAQGAIEALEEAGIATKPVITGQDNTAMAQANIQSGKQTMTIDKNLKDMAYNTAMIVNSLIYNSPIHTTHRISGQPSVGRPV